MMSYGYGKKFNSTSPRAWLTAGQTIRNFKPLASSIESVYLIEASAILRERQRALLCDNVPMEEVTVGFRSRSKYAQIPVMWCEDIRFVPSGRCCECDEPRF